MSVLELATFPHRSLARHARYNGNETKVVADFSSVNFSRWGNRVLNLNASDDFLLAEKILRERKALRRAAFTSTGTTLLLLSIRKSISAEKSTTLALD